MDLVKPTPVKGEDYYKDIASWIDRMRTWRRDYRYGDNMYEQADRLIIGDHWQAHDTQNPFADNPSTLQTVNKIQSILNDYLPFLVRTSPRYLLTPTKKEHIGRARIGTAGINYFWREQKMQREYRSAIWDGLSYGTGIVKTGFTLEADVARTDTDAGAIEYDYQIRKDHPFIRRVSPKMFIWDILSPTSDLRGARRVAELFVRPLADILEDDRYDQELRNRLRSGEETPMSYLDFLTQNSELDSSGLVNQEGTYEEEVGVQNLVVLAEVWDKKTDAYLVVLLGVEEPLIEDEWKFPYLDGFPYVMWKYMDIADQPGSPGIPSILRDMQLEYDRIRTAEYDHRRKFGKAKYVVSDQTFTKEQEEKLLANRDEVIRATHPDLINELKPPVFPDSNRETMAGIGDDMNEMMGRDALMEGGNLPSRTSAREIQARQSNMSLKAQDRITRVDTFAEDIGTQVWQHLQANITTERVIQITDHPDGPQWETLSHEAIQGEFGMELTSSSKPPLSPEEDKRQRMELLQLAVQAEPAMNASGKGFEWDKLMAFVLDGFDTPPGESFIVDMQTGEDFDETTDAETAAALAVNSVDAPAHPDHPTPGPVSPGSEAQGLTGAVQGGGGTVANV
jgi:hypothetical protein